MLENAWQLQKHIYLTIVDRESYAYGYSGDEKHMSYLKASNPYAFHRLRRLCRSQNYTEKKSSGKNANTTGSKKNLEDFSLIFQESGKRVRNI